MDFVDEGVAANMPICIIPFKNLPGYLRLLLMSYIPWNILVNPHYPMIIPWLSHDYPMIIP